MSECIECESPFHDGPCGRTTLAEIEVAPDAPESSDTAAASLRARVLALADELEHLPGLYERQYVAARIRRAVAGD